MPSLAYPKLALPDAEETIAFRAVERILRSDPDLNRVVKQWSTWTGDATDVLDPTFANCPYIQLSPGPTATDWETESQHKSPLVVSIMVAVAGSNSDQLTNLWAAIRRALFPRDLDAQAAVRAIGQAAGITKPVLTAAAYGTGVEESGLRMLIARGTLDLVLLVTT